MEEKMFEELLESVRQAKDIMKGKLKPGRIFKYGEPDVKAIRQQFNLSQDKFSVLLGISVGTLRNWEQGRRKPEGPAKVLLRVAAQRPEAILEANQVAESA